jgi:hypothetical protein
VTLAVARLVASFPAAAQGAPGPGVDPVPIGEPEEDEGYGDDDEDDDDEEDDDEEPMQLGGTPGTREAQR